MYYNHIGDKLLTGDVLILGPGTLVPNEYFSFDMTQPER